jgi:hypothetical protein
MNGLTLYPGISLVQNIGFDGSGENCSNVDKYDIELQHKEISLYKIPIKENKRIASYIKIWNSGHWYSKRYRTKWIKILKSYFNLK